MLDPVVLRDRAKFTVLSATLAKTYPCFPLVAFTHILRSQIVKKQSTKLQLCALSAQLNKSIQRENIHDTYRTLNFLSKPVKPETSTNDSVGNEKSHT